MSASHCAHLAPRNAQLSCIIGTEVVLLQKKKINLFTMQIVYNISIKICHLTDEKREIHSSKQPIRSQRRCAAFLLGRTC